MVRERGVNGGWTGGWAGSASNMTEGNNIDKKHEKCFKYQKDFT